MKRLHIVLAVVAFVLVSVLGAWLGVSYMSSIQHQPTVEKGQEDTVEAEDNLKVYKDAVEEIRQGNYTLAVDKLSQYKDGKLKAEKEHEDEIEAAYNYASAMLYLKKGNKYAAIELVNKIPKEYNGDLSQEISALREKILRTDPNQNTVTAGKASSSNRREQSGSDMVAYVQKLELINNRCNNQLAAIRDQEERNDIAYNQGFVGIQEYYTNKAAYEVQKQQIRLDAADQEIALIQSTAFATSERKNLELANAREKRSRIVTELGKARQAQQEVHQVTEDFDRTWSSMQ